MQQIFQENELKVFRFNYVLKENMARTRLSDFTSTSLGVFFWGGGTANGSKKAVLSKLIIAKVQVRIWELTNTNILTNDSPNCYFCYWVFKDIREAVTTQGVCMYVYNKMHIDIHTYSMFAGSKIPRCCNKQLNHPQVIRLFSPCAQTTSPATTLKGDASGHSTGIAYVASYI